MMASIGPMMSPPQRDKAAVPMMATMILLKEQVKFQPAGLFKFYICLWNNLPLG
jgi:hypothetical protein